MEESTGLCGSFEALSIDRFGNKKYLDRVKGFAYLETFHELEQWSEDNVDPVQRANTPLYKRPDTGAHHHDHIERSKVMLIHDYAGGYNDYESCQGATSEKELYSCSYLKYVDHFVYFTHKLVTIPPPTWTNVCHRSGVKILGTFIVEPGSQDVERILEEDDNGSFWVASALASLAECYGFDGWLVNIETPFPLLSWSAEKLERFLRQLRHALGSERKLVWYDALTSLNFVWYQNGLNHLNLSFAMAAGSLLTNYAWSPEIARRGKRLAEQSGLGVENLFFGIDTWAQNVQRDPKHPRVTWPNPGGGGTGTGLGMRALQDLGYPVPGTGIFAPGWSFEHFPNAGTAVDRSMWLGQYLPPDWSCDCGPSKPHSAVPYQQNGITRYSRNYPLGTEGFFHTDFRPAFTNDNKKGNSYAHIGAQAPPSQTSKVSLKFSGSSTCFGHLRTEICDSPSRCVVIADLDSEHTISGTANGYMQLAQLGISRKEKFQITVKYRRVLPEPCRVYLVVDNRRSVFIGLCNQGEGTTTATAMCDLQAGSISGISLHFDCEDASILQGGRNLVVELYSVTIQPWLRRTLRCDPANIKAEHQGPADLRHLRLSWNISHIPDTSGLPFSTITGPVAFFTLYHNGTEIGRAYALQFVVPTEYSEKWKSDGKAEIQITATGFDGSDLGSTKTMIQWPIDYDVEWIMVTPASERASFL